MDDIRRPAANPAGAPPQNGLPVHRPIPVNNPPLHHVPIRTPSPHASAIHAASPKPIPIVKEPAHVAEEAVPTHETFTAAPIPDHHTEMNVPVEQPSAAPDLSSQPDLQTAVAAPEKPLQETHQEQAPLPDTATQTEPVAPEPVVADAPAVHDDKIVYHEPESTKEPEESKGTVSQAPTTPAKKKGHGSLTPILIAVLVALALVGGAGYAYLQNQKKVVQPTATPQPQPEQTKTVPATSADVDAMSKTIEEQLKKTDDAKDYQEADLSDATLGL